MWDNLKASIASVVRTNNNQEITGANLQSVLNTIVNTVGANATFAGIAIPSTNPGTPDGPVFYIACEPGVYFNFNLTLVDGLYILENKTGSWVGTQINTGAAFEALIGYYNTVLNGASITVPEATTYRLTRGGVVRLKMLAPGTTATTLTIGNATNIPIWYNGAAVSSDNTWEAGEIISVFYDGTKFMASNSQGGGNAGKKRLTGATGYIATNGDSIGAYNSLNTYRYIKYPVNPGDIVVISGQGGVVPRLYAIARENDTIIQKEETESAVRENLVLVMPEEAKWIVLNNNYSAYPDYEWYYAKAGSTGADAILAKLAQYTKYDNSQSGLAANNVQQALDEIKKNIGDVDYDETVIPLTVIENSRYIINNGVVGIDDTYDFFKRAEPIDVSSYDKISATFYLKEAYTSVSVFTDDNGNVVGNKILNDGQGYVSFNIPDGATKLYLCTRKNESTGVYDQFGAKITEGISIMERINKMDNRVPKLYDSLGQNSDGAINQATMTKLLTKGADSHSETKNVSDFLIYNGHNSNSGTWDTSYGRFIVIPTIGLDSVYLGAPTNNQSLYWILLKSFTEPVSGGTIDFCDGFSGYQTTGAPASAATVSIPDDCNYLVVYRYLGTNNQYNVTPSSIILNFKAIVGMSGIEGSISTDTTKIGEIPIFAAENGSIYNNSTNIQICSKFIPVKPLTKYRFSSSRNNTLCILTSDSYTAGQSISNFATGESIRTISAGGNLELTTPSNAAYALFRTTAADGTPITISVTEILDVSTALALCESQISEANDDIERILYRDAANIRYSDFYDSSLSDNEVWDNILSATSFIPKKNIVIDRNMAISRVLYVGSNTTIYIDNVTIKQADDVFDNVFRGINEIPTTSEGYDIVAGEDLELLENIKIIGIGNARIEGPDYASKIGTDKNGTRTSQVSFDRVKGLEIGNIAYSKTRGWCHCFMFVEDAYIHDILFDSLENGANRDGFDFRSGCHDIVVENVGGRTGDDLFAFHAHNVASLNGTREGYPRRYFCIQYIDKLNNENRLSELDVHDCRINNSYKYNGYWHVGICLAGHGTHTYNISITNIKVGGHITSGQDYIQGLITLYKFGNYINDHMHDILVSNIINDSDSNMPVFNNDCKVYNVWVNKLVNNTTNKTADIQYGEGVTLLNTGNYHRISGTFTQSGAALVNKDIVFTSSGVSYTAKTNSNGYNTFLPAGTYTVTCSGYTLDVSSITIGSSDVVQNISAT